MLAKWEGGARMRMCALSLWLPLWALLWLAMPGSAVTIDAFAADTSAAATLARAKAEHDGSFPVVAADERGIPPPMVLSKESS